MRETERERADERNQMTRRGTRRQRPDDQTRPRETRTKQRQAPLLFCPFHLRLSTQPTQQRACIYLASTNSMIDPLSCQQYNQAVMTQADIIACADSSLAVTVT